MSQSALPAEPFLEWLRFKINRYGLSQVTLDTGISPRRLQVFRDGCYKNKGVMVKIHTVPVKTVDTALTKDGAMSIYDLYPDF